MSRKRYRDMSVEELMEVHRQDALEQREREEYRLAALDVTRGEYEALLARVEELESKNG